MRMVSVDHEQPSLRGTFTFDGETFESFGFNEVHSVRIPLTLMTGIELSLESGMLKTPALTIEASGGCLGLHQAFEPSDEEAVALEAFAAEMQAAIERKGIQ